MALDQVYANLSISIDGITSATNYTRSLDFSTGLHSTTYSANDGNTYTNTVYCSYPDQVCIYDLESSAPLPEVSISLENQLTTAPFNMSCGHQYVTLEGITQAGPPQGMQYAGVARLVRSKRNRKMQRHVFDDTFWVRQGPRSV